MRVNISVPDELADQVRTRGLPVSGICQAALREALRRQLLDVIDPTGESHEALTALRRELDDINTAHAEAVRRNAEAVARYMTAKMVASGQLPEGWRFEYE